MGPAKWTGAGLLGTLEGMALAPLLPRTPIALAAFLLAASLGAAALCGRAQSILGREDDPRIVLDEIVGIWAALACLPMTFGVLTVQLVLFRLLDSLKIGPIRRLERLPGGWGVVADDLGAGLAANAIIRAVLPWCPWLAA